MKPVLYSNNCPKCRFLKNFLDEKGIEYVVSEDMNHLMEIGKSSVPWLEVDGVLLSYGEAIKWAREG